MIETTIGALVRAEPVLARLGELRLAAKVSYHVMKLARLTAAETTHFEQQRIALVRELGAPRADGEVEIARDGPAWPEFVRRLHEHGAVSVTLAWRPLTLTMLDGVEISAAELAALDHLVTDDDAQATPQE